MNNSSVAPTATDPIAPTVQLNLGGAIPVVRVDSKLDYPFGHAPTARIFADRVARGDRWNLDRMAQSPAAHNVYHAPTTGWVTVDPLAQEDAEDLAADAEAAA